MPSVWDMKDILNIPEHKVTVFPGKTANIFYKNFSGPFRGVSASMNKYSIMVEKW